MSTSIDITEVDQFANLLETLTVPNNVIRQAGEKQYTLLKENDGGLLSFLLLSVVRLDRYEPNIRRLAAVLLRRIVIQDENSVYDQIDEQGKIRLKSNLITALDEESDSYLKSRICDIVGELASFIADDWPEILPYTYNCMQSSDAQVKEVGLSLIGMLAEQAAHVISTNGGPGSLIDIYSQALSDPSNDGRIILSAIRSLSSILSFLPQQSDIELFGPLLPVVLQSLQVLVGLDSADYIASGGNLDAMNLQHRALALSYIESLIEIAEDSPTFFETYLEEVFVACCELLDPSISGYVSSPIKQMILEILIALSGSITKQIRKLKCSAPGGQKGYFVSRLFPLCISMMVTIPDERGWEDAITPEESVESITDSDVAETALDRMCKALGLTSTWGVVSGQLGPLLHSADWKYLHTGLRYLGNYMEVSKSIANKRQLKEHVTDMGTRIMSFLFYPHPRVRGAALYALGQFFSMHRETITNNQISLVLPHVLQSISIDVNPSPRVRRNALLCLMNIIDSSSAVAIIEANTGPILDAVTRALTSAQVVMVQELCVSVIISLAETLGTGGGTGNILKEHYDDLMPILKQLLGYARANGLESLLGQGMECCAMVGECSGKEKFYFDALEMMNSLVTMQSELEEGSEARKYLMKAWVRIARCLESDFLPFLDLVMGQLLVAISQDVTAENIDPEELETRSDIEMVQMESGWVAIRTAAVEEQSSACQLVMLIADRLQEHFYPYVENTVRALVPLLSSPHEDVRSFAIVAIPELVRSTAKATSPDRSALMVLTGFVVGQLVHAIETESTIDLIMTGIQALRQVFVYSCTNWEAHRPFTPAPPVKCVPEKCISFLSETQMRTLTQCATLVLRDSLQRRAVLRAEAQVTGAVDDDDIADEQIFQQECMELHFNIYELLGVIFRTHGPLFLPVFEEVWHGAVVTMAHQNCLKEDRQFAFFVMSDVVEFGLSPSRAKEYFDIVIPYFIEDCKSEEPSIRQTCSYSLGIAAEMHPDAFKSFAPAALAALAAAIALGESPDDARGQSTDNAVSAVGIILEKMDKIGPASCIETFPYVWGQWIAYLPIRDDVEEGGKVLRQLCHLMKSKHAPLFCTQQRVEDAVLILLEVLGTKLVGDELTREIVHTLQLLRLYNGLLGANGVDALLTRWPSEQAEKLRAYISMDLSSPFQSSSPQAPAPIHEVLMRPNFGA